MNKRRIVETYTQGWERGNKEQILSVLNTDCTIIESHGPLYRGLQKVELWIDDWKKKRNRVMRWDIKSFYVLQDTVLFEWHFQCMVDNMAHAFDGISIVKFSKNKISYIREYKTTAPLYTPN